LVEKMRLAEFIRANIEEISGEWEKFAGTLIPEEKFSSSVLRNSIEELLKAIADDMDIPLSDYQQRQKSKGKARSKKIKEVTDKHVADRVKMGVSSQQLLSEFRALRAAILRLWSEDKEESDLTDLKDIIRLNGGVDAAIREAEAQYTVTMEQSRELFLGILAHDLRNPLWAISGAADLILRNPQDQKVPILANQIVVSVGHMKHMIGDLIELTRIKLGKGIAISPVKTDMKEICQKAIEEIRVAYPGKVFRIEAENGLVGEWDSAKLNQVLSNLLGNAAQHGSPDSEITVAARKVDNGVELRVHNEGNPISKKLLPKLFDRFVQERAGKADVEKKLGSMGLGLYIAKEIVVAHGGTIKADSSEKDGTTFSACLPQSAAQLHSAAL
jgi:signal transduction histidine kinase